MRRRVGFMGAALLAVLGIGACAGPRPQPTPPVVPSGWRIADEAAVRPTLEEIFLDPPPFGEPPRIHSVSADGRFALIRWGEGPDGENGPRLVGTRPVPGEKAGVPIGLLLPRDGDDGEEAEEAAGSRRSPRITSAWSHFGHRLAVARGTSIWMLDPASREVELFARWEMPVDPEPVEPAPDETEAAEDAEPEENTTEDAEEEDWTIIDETLPDLAFEEVRSLSFAHDDGVLWVDDGEEVLALALDAATPIDLSEGSEAWAAWPSREVDSPARRLTWNDARTVVFGQDPEPRPERSPANQIWMVDERREVALEGWHEGGELTSASLSPDGGYLFALEVDHADRPEPVEIPNYLTERVTHRDGRRSLADDRPSPWRAWIWNTSTGARQELDFGPPLPIAPVPPDVAGEDAEAPAEPRDRMRVVGWSRPTEGPPSLALERTSEDFRVLEVWTWTPSADDGLVRRHVERSPGWVGGSGRRTRWEAGGAALLIGSEDAADSSTPGRAQVFRAPLARDELRQITAVAGEVQGFTPLPDGGLLVLANGAEPARRGYLFLDRDAARGVPGTTPTPYDLPPGYASDGRASRDGARLFARHATLLQPAEVLAASARDAVRVTQTIPDAHTDLALEPPRKLEVVHDDGTAVRSHVYLPAGVGLEGGGPPRAAIVFIHGAGYLQNVTDSLTRYPLNALFHVRLARMGYVVVDVDFRGSAGYGGRFRDDVQFQLGALELADIHLVIDELVARGLVDAQRVGAYGGSYGGFLTLMALFTAPERWSVGCALRSVTDWRTYHPGYTVPRLGRPSTHAAAYERSSPIDLVDGLADPLLVLHGMMDSNVFAQDSVRLIEALIDRGKEFDAMLYPSQSHAFADGEHWLDEYKRIERFLIEHLGPPLVDGYGTEGAVWIDGVYHPYPFGYWPGGPPGHDPGERGASFDAGGFGSLSWLGDLLRGAGDDDEDRGEDADDDWNAPTRIEAPTRNERSGGRSRG